jgi:DNA repair photolyase
MPITGTKEWMPNSANCILGCRNFCKYCYGCGNALRFGRIKDRSEWENEKQNKNANKRIKLYKGGVMFPTTHDLRIEHRDWWMPFLQGLLDKGNDILIVSKPQLESINLICSSFYKYKPQIEFRFTIGTLDEYVRKFWEPNAPSMEERVDALNCAYTYGFKTSVSMEPLLTKYPEVVIDKLQPIVTETIWVGCMNHMSTKVFTPDTMNWYNQIKEINTYDNIKRIYEQLKDNPKIRWKDSVRDLLGLKE